MCVVMVPVKALPSGGDAIAAATAAIAIPVLTRDITPPAARQAGERLRWLHQHPQHPLFARCDSCGQQHAGPRCGRTRPSRRQWQPPQSSSAVTRGHLHRSVAGAATHSDLAPWQNGTRAIEPACRDPGRTKSTQPWRPLYRPARQACARAGMKSLRETYRSSGTACRQSPQPAPDRIDQRARTSPPARPLAARSAVAEVQLAQQRDATLRW